MPVVEILHGLFECNCNEQANDDRSEMDEEIFPGVHGFLRGVYL
jgi:hypothetical protein